MNNVTWWWKDLSTAALTTLASTPSIQHVSLVSRSFSLTAAHYFPRPPLLLLLLLARNAAAEWQTAVVSVITRRVSSSQQPESQPQRYVIGVASATRPLSSRTQLSLKAQQSHAHFTANELRFWAWVYFFLSISCVRNISVRNARAACAVMIDWLITGLRRRAAISGTPDSRQRQSQV